MIEDRHIVVDREYSIAAEEVDKYRMSAAAVAAAVGKLDRAVQEVVSSNTVVDLVLVEDTVGEDIESSKSLGRSLLREYLFSVICSVGRICSVECSPIIQNLRNLEKQDCKVVQT